jgi:Zn finger protein HypA/HybF involved in hydrogenase expression
MEDKENIAIKDTSALYCPTCKKPTEKVVKAAEDNFAVLRCPKCDKAMASGKFIGFRAICPNCGELVIVFEGQMS